MILDEPRRRQVRGLLALRDEDWRDQARCDPDKYPTEPDWWFPDSDRDFTQTNRAKRRCVVCPVRAECLAYAFSIPDTQGIWGGATERERQFWQRRGFAVQRMLELLDEQAVAWNLRSAEVAA